jgi:hypothetical protein
MTRKIMKETDDEEDHEGVKIGGMVNSSPTDVLPPVW